MSDDILARYTSARAIEAPALLLKDAIEEVKKLREEIARLAEQLRLANVDCFNMEAENARLREALAPFVDAGHAKIVVTTGATEEDNMINICVKERDLRRAKEISK